jgi:hypothetical protein
VKIGIAAAGVAAALALAASGCGGSGGAAEHVSPAERAAAPAVGCTGAVRAGWQQLANRIHAAVYCPAWMPDPFTGRLHDQKWNTIYSVSHDRSYLMGFIWLEVGSGELHVNLRGYPGRKTIPRCIDVEITGGKTTQTKVPCFQDRAGTKQFGNIRATVYTRNQDADLWHILYAWRAHGGLYTLSQHVTPPLTYAKVVANLDRMMHSLTVIEPNA